MNNLTTPDLWLLAILTLLCVFSIGLLLGWALGKNHRRQSYHALRDRMEGEVSSWKRAYKDALGRIRKHPFNS